MTFVEIGLSRVEEELRRFKGIMETLQVQFFLMSGTLLGLKRAGELIPWDHDFDIGLLDGTLVEPLSEMLKPFYDIIEPHLDVPNGAYLWLRHTLEPGVVCSFELRAFYFKGETAFFNQDFGFDPPNKYVNLTWPAEHLRTLDTIRFHEEVYAAPSQADKFLERMYGPTWILPREYTDWRYNTFNVNPGVFEVPHG